MIEKPSRGPYPGPRPFETSQESIFFGRAREIADLTSLIIANRALLLYAPSGAGKTSLLNAGVIPRLKSRGLSVMPSARVRGLIPPTVETKTVPNIYSANVLTGWAEAKSDPQRLTTLDLAGFLKEHPQPKDASGETVPRVLVFDQFEELFSSYPDRWQEREPFVQQISDALSAEPLARAVFALRADYLASLDRYAPLLPDRLRARFGLEPLSADAALLAVERPLESTRRRFAPGVARQLIQELLKVQTQDESGATVEAVGEFVEPVQLQVVCQNLWEELPPETEVISVQNLQMFGNVSEALREFYEKAIRKVVDETRVDETLIRNWFEKSLITSGGTRGLVFRAKENTADLSNRAVDVLEDEHIIRAEFRAGARWYELTHDRFIGPIRASNQAWRETIDDRVRSLLDRANNEQYGQKLYDQAISDYTQAISLDLKNSSAFYNRGNAYYALKQYDLAIADYDEALALEPQNADAYLNRGLCYYYANQLDKALADYDQAIAQDPTSAFAYNNRGLVYFAQKRHDLAIADYGQAITLDPKYAYPYNNRGLVYYDRQQTDLALADYSQAISIDPKYVNAYYNRGIAFRGKGDLNSAIADYTTVVGLDPAYTNAYYNRGNAYYAGEQYDAAISDYTQVIALDPKYVDAFYNRGSAYYAMKKYDLALADYNQTIALDPAYALAYNYRGNIYYNQKQYPLALADYDKAIELDPSSSSAYNNRGNAYYAQKQNDLALADYNQATTLNPIFVSGIFNRGILYYDQQQYDLALADFNQVISLDPKYIDALNYRGSCYYQQKQYDLAIADYSQVLATDPNYANGYYNRALVYREKGTKAEAEADFKKYLELSPQAADRGQVEGWLKELGGSE